MDSRQLPLIDLAVRCLAVFMTATDQVFMRLFVVSGNLLPLRDAQRVREGR